MVWDASLLRIVGILESHSVAVSMAFLATLARQLKVSSLA